MVINPKFENSVKKPSLQDILDEEIISCVLKFKKENVVSIGLAVVLVENCSLTDFYALQKILKAKSLGFFSLFKKKSKDIKLKDLKKDIDILNTNSLIHGINIQIPLPAHLKPESIISLVKPKKDSYCMTLENRALLWSGHPRVIPCPALAVMALLKHHNVSIEGKDAVVVGRSQMAGLPIFQQLLFNNSSVTVCHSHTKNLKDIISRGDIIVVCTGKKEMLTWKNFKEGAVVIDMGIHKDEKGFSGDVKKDNLQNHLFGYFSGREDIAPLTISMLLKNTCNLALAP